MLEVLTAEKFAARMAISGDGKRPYLAPLAHLVRRCITSWGRPARQRVSGYLHRQLLAMGYDEEDAHTQVRITIDGLLDIGDIAAVRIDGKASLVITRPRLVAVSENEHVLLGGTSTVLPAIHLDCSNNAIARHVTGAAEQLSQAGERIEFNDWIGPDGYLRHLWRRSSGDAQASLGDFWTVLTRVLEQDGAPISRQNVRGLVQPPAWRGGFFGHHDKSGGEGRWAATVPEGIWCAVRAGRNANEWHPILVDARAEQLRSIDLYDRDEWAWALRARGVIVGAPERMTEHGDTVQFEQPAPDQFRRALRLLGGSGQRGWSWQLSPAARARFRQYYDRFA